MENYKTAKEINNQLYVSGQIPETYDGSIELQIRECIDKVLAIGEEHHFSKDDLVSTTVYLTDINEINYLNDVYQETEINQITTRSTVEVAKLVYDVKVEISAIFMKED